MNLDQAVREFRAFSAGLKADFGQISKPEAQTAAAKFWQIRNSLPSFYQDNFAREIQAADPELFELIKTYKDNAQDNSGPAHPV